VVIGTFCRQDSIEHTASGLVSFSSAPKAGRLASQKAQMNQSGYRQGRFGKVWTANGVLREESDRLNWDFGKGLIRSAAELTKGDA
jgi:hypothetical protein